MSTPGLEDQALVPLRGGPFKKFNIPPSLLTYLARGKTQRDSVYRAYALSLGERNKVRE